METVIKPLDASTRTSTTIRCKEAVGEVVGAASWWMAGGDRTWGCRCPSGSSTETAAGAGPAGGGPVGPGKRGSTDTRE